jgi:hypothetical protein
MAERNSPKVNRALMGQLSKADASRAEAALKLIEKRRSAHEAARRKAFDDALEDARAGLYALVGRKELASLRRVLRDGRTEMRLLLQPPKGLDRDPATLDRARRREVAGLLKDLGVDRKALAKVGAAFRKRAGKLLDGLPAGAELVTGFHTASNLKTWGKLSPTHQVGLPWGVGLPGEDPRDPFRRFLFRPPFFEWPERFIHDLVSDGFEITFDSPNRGFSGSVRQDLRVRLENSGDFDLANTSLETRQGFIFDVPADGRLEIILDAVCEIGVHDVSTENEIGWSDIEIHETNFLTIEILHPSAPSFHIAPVSEFFSRSVGATRHHEVLIPGEHYFAFGVGAPLTAGRSVVVLIGTLTNHTSFCNDTGLDSAARFHWLLRSAEARIRPSV